jgi:hypothetical protein
MGLVLTGACRIFPKTMSRLIHRRLDLSVDE